MGRRVGRRTVLAVGTAVLALGPLASPVGADHTGDQAPNAVQLLVAPSLVRVQASWPAGDVVGGPARSVTCTGFFVHPDGYLVTAGRCVDVDGVPAGSVTVTIGDGVAEHTPVVARVLEAGTDDGDDIALLKIPGQHLLPLALATDEPAEAPVLVSGFSAEVAAVTSGGQATFVVAQLVRTRDRENPTHRVDRPVDAGLVGGPVVSQDGAVLGIASATAPSEAQSFTSVTPAARVRTLLARHDVANVLGPAGTAFHEGMRSYLAYDWRGAVAPLKRALALNPNLPTVQEIASTASYEALWQSPPSDDDGVPWALVAAAVAVSGALAVGTIVVVRRRAARGAGTRLVPAADAPPA